MSDEHPIETAAPGWLARYRRRLPWFVLGAVVLGAASGIALHAAGATPEDLARWNVGLPGDIFLRLLKMVVVPLIAAAMITGVSGAGDIRAVGRLGAWTAVYYLATTAGAVAIGISLVGLLEPGAGVDLAAAQEVPPELLVRKRSFSDFALGLFSANPVGDAAADLGESRLLPLLFFCILFGAVLTTMRGPGRETVSRFFEGLYGVMTRITDLVILLTPFGVFFLVLRTMTAAGAAAFGAIGVFFAVVIAGLAIQGLVVLPLLVRLFGRLHPFRLMAQAGPALVTAFSTSSSSATIPLTIDCCVRRASIPERVANFCLPLGATVNMNGTALYEAVAAVFVAQAYGIRLDMAGQAMILVLATLSAVGTAGIPSASLVMIAVILSTLGLPVEGLGLILAVDRILDMCRTTVNVWGDVTGAAIFASVERRREAARAGSP